MLGAFAEDEPTEVLVEAEQDRFKVVAVDGKQFFYSEIDIILVLKNIFWGRIVFLKNIGFCKQTLQ